MSLTPYFTTHYLAKIMLQYDNNLSKKIKLGTRSDANGPKTTYHENLLDLTCKSGKDAMRHGMTLTMKMN